MWEILRKNTKKIVWVIMLLIIPAFFLWGVSGVLMGRKTNPVVGKIAGKKIYLSQYNKEYQSVLFMMQLMYRENFSRMRSFFDFKKRTWERMLLLKEIDKHNIKTGKKELIEFIQKFDIFKVNGEFDVNQYETIVFKGLKMTPSAFEAEMRVYLAMNKLKDFIRKGVVVSEEEALQLFMQENKERKAGYVVFEGKKYEEAVEVSDSEIEKYFEDHRQEFEVPDQVKVKYIMQDFSMLEKGITIKEEDIKEVYEQNKEHYKKGDKPKTFEETKDMIQKQLLYTKTRSLAEEKMNTIYYLLEENSDLEKAAQENGLQVKETAFFKKGEMVPDVGMSTEFSMIPFGLDVGEFSEPINTGRGICILSLIEKKEAYIPKLEEMRIRVAEKLKLEKAKDVSKEKAQEMQKKFKEKVDEEKFTFVEACNILHLEPKETEFFKKGGYVQGIYDFRAFSEMAFSTDLYKVSEVFKSNHSYLFLMPIADKVPEVAKFEEQKEAFLKRVQGEKENRLLSDWMSSLFKKYRLEDYTAKVPELSGR